MPRDRGALGEWIYVPAVTRSVPSLVDSNDPTSVEGVLREVNAAIVMVARGIAVTVRLCNLPGAGDAAFDAAARAQAAAVGFGLQRDHPGSTTMIVGPRLEIELVRRESAVADAPA